jgi:hypothetical protein
VVKIEFKLGSIYLIGIVASEREKVKGYISVSGIGDSADKTLKEQLKDKLPIFLMVASNQILDSLKAGKTVEKVDKNIDNFQFYLSPKMKKKLFKNIGIGYQNVKILMK